MFIKISNTYLNLNNICQVECLLNPSNQVYVKVYLMNGTVRVFTGEDALELINVLDNLVVVIGYPM